MKNNKLKFKLIGYLNAPMGIGYAARLSAKVIDSMGLPYSVHSINSETSEKDSVLTSLKMDETDDHNVVILQINADNTLICDKFIPENFLRNKYKIGYWAWELSRFPDEWNAAIDKVDEIWVPSEFAKESIAKNTSKPIHVVHHPIDTSKPFPFSDKKFFNLKEDHFYFLMMMDLNSYVERKNPFSTIAAFKRAFNVDEKVGLIVKLHGKSDFPEERNRLKEIVQDDPRILVIDKSLPKDQVDTLQMTADCYVSLHRSEGFGMNLAECMSYGKPVIATGYSGNVDFMSKENSFLVDYDLISVKENEYPFWNNQVWADPNVSQAADYMREIFKNSVLRQDIGLKAFNSVREKLNFASVAKEMLKSFSTICL